MLDRERLAAAAFDQFVRLPENVARSFELIAGEIVEVVSNGYSSEIGAYLCGRLALYARQHKLGRVTGADGGYAIGDERYIPDCAFVRQERQSQPSFEGYNPIAPDLAVEVLSPSNTPDEITTKVVNYLNSGATVWVISVVSQRATIYRPGQAAQVLTLDESLVGDDLLPGFSLPLRDLFDL